ncbi:MAG TPA: hypothetical protein VHV30_13925 [Polyangiaceae bacterium]|nr:hypothetical protein [Polyangiaceae bacterium]
MADGRQAIAERLFAGVLAPLAMGGAIAPGHAVGARAALALGEGLTPGDTELFARVQAARLHRARRLAPVDALNPPSGAEWALGAAFHDLLQAANPTFDAPLRRASAARILELAIGTLERVAPPATAGEALARHTWFARVPEVRRTDVEVRWWTGSREFLGAEPPRRLQAWPHLRRVLVSRVPRALLDLTPLAVDRERLTAGVSELLARTPLTDLATCTRASPLFEWRPPSLALLATGSGRTLALRALGRVPAAEVDAALGRATRALLGGPRRELAGSAVALLADRAVANAQQRLQSDRARPPVAETSFAQAVGALMARRALVAGEGAWSAAERASLIDALAQPARSAAAREAHHLFEGS